MCDGPDDVAVVTVSDVGRLVGRLDLIDERLGRVYRNVVATAVSSERSVRLLREIRFAARVIAFLLAALLAAGLGGCL